MHENTGPAEPIENWGGAKSQLKPPHIFVPQFLRLFAAFERNCNPNEKGDCYI